MRRVVLSIVFVTVVLLLGASTATSALAASGHAQMVMPARYHVVRPGDTLFCLGRGYGIDPWTIAYANGLANPNLLSPGTVLTIPYSPLLPPGALGYGPVCSPNPPGGQTVPCARTHMVREGENLFRISMMYNVSMWSIMQANGLSNPNYIRAYYPLCIPGQP